MFKKYHKIESLYKRDNAGKFIIGDYTCEEFELLENIKWDYSEKIDGTNIRIYWDGNVLKYGGRTDNAQIPTVLYDKLQEIFFKEKMLNIFPNFTIEKPLILFGEGYGKNIQKVGEFYLKDKVNFILYDVNIYKIWLSRNNVIEIAKKLNIDSVPIVKNGNLQDAIKFVKNGFKSHIADYMAEGLVLRQSIELRDRLGNRIITKIKHIDFNNC